MKKTVLKIMEKLHEQSESDHDEDSDCDIEERADSSGNHTSSADDSETDGNLKVSMAKTRAQTITNTKNDLKKNI